MEDQDNIIISHTNQLRNIDKNNIETADNIKELGVKIDQQGLLVVDHMKQLAKQDEKMTEIKEDVRDVKKSLSKIDVVDKKVSDLSSSVDKQFNDNKIMVSNIISDILI